ncbi:hypothetical protein F4781DRAFT_302270 [Annulohypoxylon bovei var. microspora]|nr:hypothetical protein F4781DRAFT_302270 [Annulohypoxylon bovei var. microspora]
MRIPDNSFATMSTMSVDQNHNLDTMVELACSYKQQGQLKDAEILLVRADTLLTDAPGNTRLKLQIRWQIASIRLHLGKYEDGKNDLKATQRGIKDLVSGTADDKDFKGQLEFDCLRLLARHKFMIGDWKNAAREFRKLLEHKKYSFKINRDLALTYGYLGDYARAKSHIEIAWSHLNPLGDSGHAVDSKVLATSSLFDHDRVLEIKRCGVRIVETTIDMLHGNYQTALQGATKSLRFMEETFGPVHFKTLAVANLELWCLVHEGRFARSSMHGNFLEDIERRCSTAVERLTHNLGHRHPLTLESMKCLVRVFRRQARFTEAIDTGKLLCENATQTLGHLHPQTIDIKCELAAAHLSGGNYRTSVFMFADVLREAEHILGSEHPKILQYGFELARAYLYNGKITKASDKVLKIVLKQIRRIYGGRGSAIPQTNTPSLQTLVWALEAWIRNDLEFQIHPYLISGLQLLAQIELRRCQTRVPGGDLAIAERILRFLMGRVSISNGDGEKSVTKASILFDFAIVLREKYPDSSDLYESIEILEEVVRDREVLFGEQHVETLRAQQELTKAKFMQEVSRAEANGDDYFNSAAFESVSKYILDSLESRYGSQYPQTLSSRLWCLQLDLMMCTFTSAGIEEQVLNITRILSAPGLVSERPVESIATKIALANILVRYGISHWARELLDSTEKQIDEVWVEDMGPRDALDGLRIVIGEINVMVRGSIT